MKTLRSALLASALLGSTPAFAILPGSTAGLTFSFTASYTAPGIKVIDPVTKEVSYVVDKETEKRNKDGETIEVTTEAKTVTNTYRYGNAELVKDLLDEGIIEDTTTNGWSIIQARLAYTDESPEIDAPAFYAVKKNKPPVLIYIPSESIASAETSTSKIVENFVTGYYKYTDTVTRKTFGTLHLSGFHLFGLATQTHTLTFGTLGKGVNTVFYGISLGGAHKFAGLAGTYAEDAVGEGTFSISGAKIVDLATLGFTSAVLVDNLQINYIAVSKE